MATATVAPMPTYGNFKNLTGKRFGRLLVVSYAGKNKIRKPVWNAVCDCGTERTVIAGSLRGGLTRSCGCLRDEVASEVHTTHGEADKTLEYSSWAAMLSRCGTPGNTEFSNYGGRGIAVYWHWHSYENFLADMGRAPSPKYSIDRIDNDGNYESSNCRWATHQQQCRNKRTNVMLTLNDKTMCIVEWAEETGLQSHLIGQRLGRGWSVERAITTPAATYRRSK